MELLEDVMVEYQQAIEMTTIYRDIIDGTRQLLSSVIDNRLNSAMKYLTSITLVMAIPTIISGISGMNVDSAGMRLFRFTIRLWNNMRYYIYYMPCYFLDFEA